MQLSYTNGAQASGPRLAVIENPGVEDTVVSIAFGETDSGAGVTGFTTSSSISVADVDGRPIGFVTDATFDRSGVLVLNYSNGEQDESRQLALASVTDMNGLRSVGDALFLAPSGLRVTFGRAGEGAFGEIESNSLELSNVELSREFAEIIIVQRGYQASSQVMNVTNEMIQELYSSIRGS